MCQELKWKTNISHCTLLLSYILMALFRDTLLAYICRTWSERLNLLSSCFKKIIFSKAKCLSVLSQSEFVQPIIFLSYFSSYFSILVLSYFLFLSRSDIISSPSSVSLRHLPLSLHCYKIIHQMLTTI